MNLKPLRNLLASGLLLVVACVAAAPAWAAQNAEPAAPSIKDTAEMAFWWGDFDALEKQNALYRQPGSFMPDGVSDVDLFRAGLDLVFDDKEKNAEPYLLELEALTQQWAGAHPKSALAHIMYANALLAHAWSYRGNGYAKDVPPEAWREFHAYLMRAFEYLKAHADVAFTDSYAHWTMLKIGRGLGWDRSQLEAIAQDGLKRNPQDISLYFEVLEAMLPKWGGDARTLDDYIRRTAEQTKAEYGMGMYARLYSAALDEDYGHALFESSYADWALLKQGFEDMHARYPNSPERRNRFAYMACLAKDKATLVALLDELGPKLDARQWGPNPERSLEGCKRWASEKVSEKGSEKPAAPSTAPAGI